jgi:hypothetical protein
VWTAQPAYLLPVQVELLEIVDFFRQPQKFRASGARAPKGVLLVGGWVHEVCVWGGAGRVVVATCTIGYRLTTASLRHGRNNVSASLNPSCRIAVPTLSAELKSQAKQTSCSMRFDPNCAAGPPGNGKTLMAR